MLSSNASREAFRKLSPEVQRELLRHVKPLPTKSSGSTTSTSSTSSTYAWLLGCVALVGAAASLPYWATRTIGHLTDRDEPLNASGVRRGAFANSGSRDAGKDPNWDWKHGQYVYPKGFAEHLKMQDPKQTDLGPELGSMLETSQQQEKQPLRRRQQQQQ